MSLRRSARISASTAPGPAFHQRTYAKPTSKVTSEPKKRKSRASIASTSSVNKSAKEAAAESIFAPDPVFAVPDLPTTPLPKRRKGTAGESPIKLPPITPTPSGVGLLAHTHASETDRLSENTAGLKPRPAEPHITNAPLSTPGGSRVTAYKSSPAQPSDPQASQEAEPSPAKRRTKKEVPPDVGVLNKPTATIDTLLRDAEAFLIKVDPKLKPLIEKHTCKMFSPEGLSEVVDPFTALSSGIMGQQVCIAHCKASSVPVM